MALLDMQLQLAANHFYYGHALVNMDCIISTLFMLHTGCSLSTAAHGLQLAANHFHHGAVPSARTAVAGWIVFGPFHLLAAQ